MQCNGGAQGNGTVGLEQLLPRGRDARDAVKKVFNIFYFWVPSYFDRMDIAVLPQILNKKREKFWHLVQWRKACVCSCSGQSCFYSFSWIIYAWGFNVVLLASFATVVRHVHYPERSFCVAVVATSRNELQSMCQSRFSLTDFECICWISRSASHSEAPKISVACWTAALVCVDFWQGVRTGKPSVSSWCQAIWRWLPKVMMFTSTSWFNCAVMLPKN